MSHNHAASPDDAPNIGFAILSFLIPIVGLVLYLMWKDASPLKAKSCGKGAIIGFVVSIVSGILMGIFSSCIIASYVYSVSIPLL